MRNEFYARNPKTVRYDPTAHVVYAKYFCNMFALYNSTVVLSSQFLVYLKFVYLFNFILHIILKNYSYMIYLGIFLTFRTCRQSKLIRFTLYCNSYVKVNRK